MKHLVFALIAGLLVIGSTYYLYPRTDFAASEPQHASFTEEEAGFDDTPDVIDPMSSALGLGGWYTIEELQNWERPAGPLRVGVQVGHLDNENVPEELAGLTRNGAGATAAGFNERDVMNVIVELVAERLRTEGVVVDILPATVPPKYQADAFVSIHADGNPNSDVRGFKIAGPRRDYSGLASVLVSALYEEYDAVTDLPQDANISRRMTAYYAFNWARYEHAVHPYTPAAIVETGFLTNPADRELIVNQPEVAAEGIANGILTFLATERTPEPPPQEFYQPTLPLTGQVECAQVRAERRDRDDGTCFPSVRTQDGRNYIIVDGELATSTLESEPYRATVSGTYRPVQTLENYFWFNFEVVGLIFEPTVNRFEEGSE